VSDRLDNPLVEHTLACDDCRADAPPVAQLAALLDGAGVDVDAAYLSRLAFARVAPELRARAQAAFWRRLRTALAFGLLPLPLVIAADVFVLGWLYQLFAVWLPASLALYVVISYGAWLLVAIGSTYAAIPLLLARGLPGPEPAPA
jgi:hypothetical protein